MNVRNKSFLRLVLLCCGLCCARCGVSSLDTGGSSGTEVSAMAGIVVDASNNPVANAHVRLRPADFLADSALVSSYVSSRSILDTFTGVDGSFSFMKLAADSYFVEVVCGDTLGSVTDARIQSGHHRITLPAMVAMPLARLSGNVQINYGFGVFPLVQIYGLERSVRPDAYGNFSIPVPQGRHRLHIGGYYADSNQRPEFDGIDIALEVRWGEHKDMGSVRLREPPPPPCLDGACDSMVVRRVLDMVGLQMVRTYEVTKVANGRIVEFNLRGRLLPNGIPPEINKLIELRVLDLGQTGLTMMFPDMGRMTKLEVVRFDGNHLGTFSSGIGNCTELKELNLYGNELTALPPSIVNLRNLRYLNLGNNRLCWVDSTMAAWIDTYDPDWRNDQRCQ